MQKLASFIWNEEPAVLVAAIMGIIELLQLFDVIALTPEQRAGVQGALVLWIGLVLRSKVTPTTRVGESS